MASAPPDASTSDQHSATIDAEPQDMSMMRIAVAGTGGLARLIAYFIVHRTSHHVIFLSRQHPPAGLADRSQVSVVDYTDLESLKYALRGIDTVISTVTGSNQLQLIRAALEVRVRRFAAAEFEGPPRLRPLNDPLDRQRLAARQWLATYAHQMQFTTFVCGILYERFQPGGLRQSRMGGTSNFDNEGDYIMDCRNMTAQIPAYDLHNNPTATICMTAAQDVARFVTKAMDMRQWPNELTMCGQRITVLELVSTVESLKGQAFNPKQLENRNTLHNQINHAIAQGNTVQAIKLHTLLATVEGRYDFAQPATLNRLFPDVRPISFRDWFVAKWSQQ